MRTSSNPRDRGKRVDLIRHSPVVELRAGHASVGVAPDIGGALTHFRWVVDGTAHDWLRFSTVADLAAGAADRLACFPLVPFSNRIRDGRFDFGGRAIRLPLSRWPQPHAIHGHGWLVAWDIVEQRRDRLGLAYEHAAAEWPFPYRVRQDIVLDEQALRLTLSVENLGADAMPVGLGWHPYFPSTAGTRLRARVDAMWATDAEAMPTALVAADPRLASDEGLPIRDVALDNVFTGWQRGATIAWPQTGAQLAIDADAPLDFLVVYAPRGKDYFCVEPVSHCTDAFNLAAQGCSDTGMGTLPPGARLQATLHLRPVLGKGSRGA